VDRNVLPDFLRTNRFGDFVLTDAIRPSNGTPVRPCEGYSVEVYRHREAKLRLPMLTATVSAERLFDVFTALVETLGSQVNVVIESSHGRSSDDHLDFRRERIDSMVLMSHLYEFEDLLLNDGCTGIAVLHPRKPVEIQFDEHKVLTMYAPNLKPFRRVMTEYHIPQLDEVPLLSKATHFHHTTDEYVDRFEQFANCLGVADFASVLSDDSMN
jgi:hypothetical protein